MSDIDADFLILDGLVVKIAGTGSTYLAHADNVNEDDYLDLILQFEDSDEWCASDNGH